MAGFEQGLIRWAVLALLLGLAIGGKRWEFPQGGEPLIERIFGSRAGGDH